MHRLICLGSMGILNEWIHFAGLHSFVSLACCKQIYNYFFLSIIYLNIRMKGNRAGFSITPAYFISTLTQNYFVKNVFGHLL